MKQPKALTPNYKLAVEAYGLNPDKYMLLKDGDVYITIVHKESGKTRIIDKYARRVEIRGRRKHKMNKENKEITVEDCLKAYSMGKTVLIEAGKVTINENIPADR